MGGDRRRLHEAVDEDGTEDMDYQYEPKRKRKVDGPAEQSFEELLVNIGSKASLPLEAAIDGLVCLIETDLPIHKHKVLDVVIKCVIDMPSKITIYSAVIGLLNAKNYNVGGEFVELVLTTLRVKLKSEFAAAQTLIIFICDLVNAYVISVQSCLEMLVNFVASTVEDGTLQQRSDFCVYAVLSALPWIGLEFNEKNPDAFAELLEQIAAYLERRNRLHVPMLRVWSSNKPHIQEDYLDCLWHQIQRLRANRWQEGHILRPYVAFDATLCEALQHNIPSFAFPATADRNVYPLATVVFRLFDSTDCPENGPLLPDAHSVERFLLELDLTWILKQYYLERKDCATALISYSKRTDVPLNYVILEVIFGQLFQLPSAPYLEIFYGSLLIELCKLQPNSMPQVLAQTAEMLYQRIDTMAAACSDRFVNWFAYHLSNFQFRWSWEDWTDCLDVDILAPKQLFVKEVLHKCMRFSYHQRVLDIVPSSFSGLVPLKPTPNFKYSQEGAENLPGTSIAQQLAQAIRGKCTSQDVSFLLRDCPLPVGFSSDETSFNPLKIDVLVLSLLNFGTKSFSHSFAALAKYHECLKELTDNNEDAQLCVLQLVFEMWSSHQQMMVVLVDKMLKMQIIECRAVITWLFSKDMQPEFLKLYVWEIMHSTLAKMSKHINKMSLEIELARQRLETNNSEDEETLVHVPVTEQDIEQMQTALESAQSEQKSLLLMMFQNFTILLTEHLLQCESEGIDYNTYWYRWVTSRLREMFLHQLDEATTYVVTLENLLFTSDIDPHILELFHQFRSLKCAYLSVKT